MKEIQILLLQGRGNGFFVKNVRSKRKRTWLIERMKLDSIAYDKLYKLRNCI